MAIFKEFQLIEADSSYQLSRFVTKEISVGFELFGNPVVVSVADFDDSTGRGFRIFYYQAMTRNKEI